LIDAFSLIGSRYNTSPKRLVAPGPNATQIELLFRAAAAAPDHGTRTPWRFVLIPADKRAQLGEVFAVALQARDPGASTEQIEAARAKAHRAPLLMAAGARLGPCEPDIPVLERMVSVGCAIQNILLTAHGMGFGTGLASGRAMSSSAMRELFKLAPGEEAVCFINIGTVSAPKAPRARPETAAFVSSL
jgi:nitroreductase